MAEFRLQASGLRLQVLLSVAALRAASIIWFGAVPPDLSGPKAKIDVAAGHLRDLFLRTED
jgi:hypothetical protein